MNSKQSVLSTVNFEPIERVPLSFSANSFVREKLKTELNLKAHLDLLNHMNSDIVDLRDCVSPQYTGPGQFIKKLPNGVLENYWGWRTKQMETPRGTEEQFCEFILQNANSTEDLERHQWPNPDWFDFSDFKAQIEPYQDLCVMASGGSVFQHPTYLRGMDTFIMDLFLNPEMAEFMMDKYTNFYLAYFDKMFSSAKGCIDIFRVADDVAMQSSLLIGPETFDRFVAPRLKKLIELAHSYDIKFMLHSCGDVTPLIPRFIELGIDILDPIQVSATNMDLFKIHQKYGHKICFHGGIDTQQFLPNASPDMVRGKIRETIDYFKNKSGYLLSTSHILEGDVTTENILALFDEGMKYQQNKVVKS